MHPIITEEKVQAAFHGFNASFAKALKETETTYKKVAMTAPSRGTSNVYKWFGNLQSLREWNSSRTPLSLGTDSYTVENKNYELTVSVSRNDIEDDQIGVYRPLFENLGEVGAHLGDDLIWPLLKSGFTQTCYDGQPFFSRTHTVADGTATENVANMDAISSSNTNNSPWFLLDTTRSVKPLIYQERRAPILVRKDSETDDNVFLNNLYLYGISARAAAGYGLWQMAYASKQTLNSSNFNSAYEKFQAIKGDNGRSLHIRPSLLVVPPELRVQAYEIVKSQRISQGVSNPNEGIVDLHVESRLV